MRSGLVDCPLVNLQKLWKDPPFSMGKSTISMVIFNSYVTRGYISHIVASSFRVTNIDDGRSLYKLTF